MVCVHVCVCMHGLVLSRALLGSHCVLGAVVVLRVTGGDAWRLGRGSKRSHRRDWAGGPGVGRRWPELETAVVPEMREGLPALCPLSTFPCLGRSVPLAR